MSWDETTLVALLKQGHEEAYAELVQRYQKRVYALAYGITLDPEESRDIVQEVFLKAFQNIKKFEGRSRLATWLHRITVNQSLNWQRRWKRRLRWHHRPIESDESGESIQLGSDEYQAEVLHDRREIDRAYKKALSQLPDDARSVYVLKEIEGLSYEDIGRVLNLKKGTVSSRLFYARKRLQAALEEFRESV
jgi:RNA polymerase sigma-70 factor (ECF subfamily)